MSGTELLVTELLDKWRDVKDTAEDLTTETLADEVVDDLREVLRWLRKTN